MQRGKKKKNNSLILVLLILDMSMINAVKVHDIH